MNKRLTDVHSRISVQDNSQSVECQRSFAAWKNPKRETLTWGFILRGVLTLFSSPSVAQVQRVLDDEGCLGFDAQELPKDTLRLVNELNDADKRGAR